MTYSIVMHSHPFTLYCVHGNLLPFIVVSKCSVTSSDSGVLKKRKTITAEVKSDIVKHLEKGEMVTNIGRLRGLSPLTFA